MAKRFPQVGRIVHYFSTGGCVPAVVTRTRMGSNDHKTDLVALKSLGDPTQEAFIGMMSTFYKRDNRDAPQAGTWHTLQECSREEIDVE